MLQLVFRDQDLPAHGFEEVLKVGKIAEAGKRQHFIPFVFRDPGKVPGLKIPDGYSMRQMKIVCKRIGQCMRKGGSCLSNGHAGKGRGVHPLRPEDGLLRGCSAAGRIRGEERQQGDESAQVKMLAP